MRVFPEAFLAPNVIVCEGASEVGLIRGIDSYRSQARLAEPIAAKGVALVDAGGVTKLYERASAFQALGYRVITFRDDDRQPAAGIEEKFLKDGGQVVKWRAGLALEQELFASLPEAAAVALVERAIELHGEDTVKANVGSAAVGTSAKADPRLLVDPDGRRQLGVAAKQADWFKTLSWMEAAAADIIAPHLSGSDPGFQMILAEIFDWIG